MGKQKQEETVNDNGLKMNWLHIINRAKQYADKVRGTLGHALSMSSNLWYASGPNQKKEILHCTDLVGRKRTQLCPLPHWTETMRVKKDENHQNARREFHLSCTVRIGITDCVFLEEGPLNNLLKRPQNLNDVTINEAYPIPGIDECLGSLGQAR